MPHGPDHLVSSYHNILEQRRQREARGLSLLFSTLDRSLEDLRVHGGEKLETEQVAKRVRLTARVRIPMDEIKMEGLDRDPFIAEEVRRQYIAAGFDDVRLRLDQGFVEFVAFDDSAEGERDRILRLLGEALQDYGAEGGEGQPPR
jgi:hypothetical protein